MSEKKDALGNDIDLSGETIYGYAGNDHGVNSVWIGRARKETKYGVTLEVIQHRTGVYGDLKEEKEKCGWIGYTKKLAKIVNVKSVMLFPLHRNFLNNIKIES